LVFLRRVKSRILYEQMIGRATRLCPDIGKERFRIFDAVDLYTALKDVTDMKPVVVDPFVTFEQLVKEIIEGKEDEDRRASIDEFLATLQRKKRSLQGEAEEQFQAAAGMNVRDLAQFLKQSTVGDAAAYLRSHLVLAAFLDRTTRSAAYKTVVSEKTDQVREVTRGYGKHGSRPPGDYLEAFRTFVANSMNKLPALLVVTQRPKELTRENLRQLRLTLDQEGFSEKSVQSASGSVRLGREAVGRAVDRQLLKSRPTPPLRQLRQIRRIDGLGLLVLGLPLVIDRRLALRLHLGELGRRPSSCRTVGSLG
jgi:type I restriction enzyme R subunit